MSSIRTYSRQVTLLKILLVLAVFLQTCAARNYDNYNPTMVTTRDSSYRDKTTYEELEDHGFGGVAEALSDLLYLFDESVHTFSKLNNDDQFIVLNDVVAQFKNSFIQSVNEALSAPNAPSGSISYETMNDLITRQERIFKDGIKRDPRILMSEWTKFLGHVHVVFDGLKHGYQGVLASGLSLNWKLLDLSLPYVEMIPDRLFDRTMFAVILEMPGQIKGALRQLLESIRTSDFAPMIKMVSNVAASYNWRQHMEAREADL